MDVFFFDHPLTPPRRGTRSPGRVPYRMRGQSVDLQAGAVRPWAGVVFGDGFSADTPGPNVDPNILADLLPWHLSFCRIGDSKPKNLVGANPPLATPSVLSDVVQCGDLVVFGGVLSTHLIFVDVVLCRERIVELPQKHGTFELQAEFTSYWTGTGGDPAVDWAAFSNSRAFRWNMRDAMPGGHHHSTARKPHKQIIGRRAVPGSTDRRSVRAALASGDGFNFVPLATEQVSVNKAVRDRPGLFTARVAGIGRLVRSTASRVWQLPLAMANELLDAIVGRADHLVLDPLEPEAIGLQ